MGNRPGQKIKLTSIDELLCVPQTAGTTDVDVNAIYPFENHPFKVLDDEKMEELVDSIKLNGILTPVIVRPDDEGTYEMISGHRRLHAAKRAGLQKIPAIVKEMTNDDAILAMVDADDWLATDAIAQAVKVFQDHPLSDCVLLRFVLAYQEGNVYRLEDYPCEEFECLSGEEAFLKSLDWRIHGIYMVRMSIQQRFRYDESARFYSDENTARLHYFV